VDLPHHAGGEQVGERVPVGRDRRREQRRPPGVQVRPGGQSVGTAAGARADADGLGRGVRRELVPRPLDHVAVLARTVGDPVEHDHDVLRVLLDVPAGAGERGEAEPLVEAVLAVLRAGRADHRLRAQRVRRTDRDGVEVRPEAQLPRAVLHDEPAVLERLRGRHARGPQRLFVALVAEERPRLEQVPRSRCREPDVAQGCAAGLAAGDEVPREEVEVLVVHVRAVRRAESRTPAVVEEHPGPQVADVVDQPGIRVVLGADEESADVPLSEHG
jgi:hypothetical protein